MALTLLPFSSVAQEASFDAYIDRENVAVGEDFQIKLELVNAQVQSPPDLSMLPEGLQVVRQQQSVSVGYINNMQVQNIAWILDMTSTAEGTYRVPSIGVSSSAGQLLTKPFRIHVKPAADYSSSGTQQGSNSVFIDAQLEKLDPFIEEPVLYKAMVYHLHEITDTELIKPKADNAIVEQVTQPKLSKQILNGVEHRVIEVEYTITPLTSGTVTIKPAILRGRIAQERPTTPMDTLFSPFANMGVSMKEFVPFSLSSKEFQLNVKPADESVNPWLVLYDLQIDDELGGVEFDQQNKRILASTAEPIARRIQMVAFGKGAEGLPDIEPMLRTDEFKVYADKPDNTHETVADAASGVSRIKGTRLQTFTFIPQKAGMLALPELKVKYWSLKDNKIETAILPARIVTVQEAGAAAVPQQPQQPQEAQPIEQPQQPQAPQTLEEKLQHLADSPQAPNVILLILALMICFIIFIFFKVLGAAKRNRMEFDEELANPQPVKKNNSIGGRNIIDNAKKVARFSSKPDPENLTSGFLPLIEATTTHAELQEVLQRFATKHLNLSQHAGTVLIASEMGNRLGIDKQLAMKYAAELDSVLYAGKRIDLQYLKNGFAELVFQAEDNIKTAAAARKEEDELISLNP